MVIGIGSLKLNLGYAQIALSLEALIQVARSSIYAKLSETIGHWPSGLGPIKQESGRIAPGVGRFTSQQ